MKFDHYAVFSKSEKDSDRFYGELLGLKKKYSFKVSSEMMNKIFKINEEFKVIRYGLEEFDIEVFITKSKLKIENPINHIGIVVKNKDRILKKTLEMGFYVNKVQKPEENSYYLFIKDSFGNYFEIKEENK
ncbi:MAG: VOC family protein [Candidatus Helarchaeota archaeon]